MSSSEALILFSIPQRFLSDTITEYHALICTNWYGRVTFNSITCDNVPFATTSDLRFPATADDIVEASQLSVCYLSYDYRNISSRVTGTAYLNGGELLMIGK